MNAFLYVSLLLGQCPGGTCAPETQRHGWYEGVRDGAIELYWHGDYVGRLETDSCEWLTAGKSEAVNLRHAFQTRKEPFPGGVDRAQIHDQESYWLNGRRCAAGQAFEAMASDSLADDSRQFHLTVIGSTEQRNRVLGDLKRDTRLAAISSQMRVQAYGPEHWAVKNMGFATAGEPTIYVQNREGMVLHRQDDYSDGPVALADALRRADPAYDASKDPDLRKVKAPKEPAPAPAPSGPSLPGLSDVPSTWYVIAGLIGLFFGRGPLANVLRWLSDRIGTKKTA